MPFVSATPSAVKQATTQNYVSTVDFLSSAKKPNVNPDFIKRYGDQSLTGFVAMVGGKRPVDNQEFIHFEEDWVHQTFSIANTVLDVDNMPGTGAYIFEITSADDADTTQDEKDYTPVRLNSIVEFENGQVGLVVALMTAGAWTTATGYTKQSAEAVAADKTYIEVLPYDGNPTAGGVTAIKSTVGIITGTEFGEGQDQPESITPNVIRYKNTVMIIKEAFEVTGSEATNAIWFKVTDPSSGQSGWLWYLKGEADTYQRMNDYAEMQMIVGQQVASGATALKALGAAGTEGLLTFAYGGNALGYVGAFGVTDLRSTIIALDKNRGAMENTMWCGLTISLDIDDNFRDYFDGAGASFGTFEGGQEKAVQMGFKSFQYGGYTIHKESYRAFNYAKMLGYTKAAGTDSKYRTMALLVPGDKQVDAKTRESIPSLSIRYKEAGGYSREMEHWLTGGAIIKDKTDGMDRMKSHYRTERGFEGFAPNRFALITKS